MNKTSCSLGSKGFDEEKANDKKIRQESETWAFYVTLYSSSWAWLERSNWLNKFKIRFSKGKNLISKHWFWCLKYEHKVFQKEISKKLNEGKGINFHIAGINSNAKESINK